MARKDCEYCGKHRARWLVIVHIKDDDKKVKLKVCGICKWKLWPSPRREKKVKIVKVLGRIRGGKKVQP